MAFFDGNLLVRISVPNTLDGMRPLTSTKFCFLTKLSLTKDRRWSEGHQNFNLTPPSGPRFIRLLATTSSNDFKWVLFINQESYSDNEIIMKLLSVLVASSIAENKSVKFVTGITSVSSEFPSDIIDLARNMFNICWLCWWLYVYGSIKMSESYWRLFQCK